MSENENPTNEVEETEEQVSEESSQDTRRSSSSNRDRRSNRRRGRGGRRGRRGRNTYCPDGPCFNYKDIDTLQQYINESGKIKPRRQTGNCARCQRELAREIKRARHLALLPFVNRN